MIRGFVVGSLSLIVLYVLVQEGSAQRVSQASSVSATLFAKLLSPGVAAIPNRAGDTGSVGKTVGSAAAAAGQQAGGYVGGAIAGGAAGGAISGGVGVINRGPLPAPNTGPTPGN